MQQVYSALATNFIRYVGYYPLWWSHVKKVFRLKTHDLHHILDKKDILYKSLGITDLLQTDQLLRSVMISNNNIPVDFLELEIEIAYLRTRELFLRRNIPSACDDTVFLLFMVQFTTALMKQYNHICDALRDLVPFIQFKKREKHPWRSVNFMNTPPWVFSRF